MKVNNLSLIHIWLLQLPGLRGFESVALFLDILNDLATAGPDEMHIIGTTDYKTQADGNERIKKILQFVENNYHNKITLEDKMCIRDRNETPYRLSSANHSANEVAVSCRRSEYNSTPSGSRREMRRAKSPSIFSQVGW